MKAICFCLLLVPMVAMAHEGHEPLPTKGATVKRDRLMLSSSASKAIGLQTAKVTLVEVARTIGAVASVELPWSQEAYVTTLIAGRIEQVLVKPGEMVAEGQELARISSSELDDLQFALLQAANQKENTARILRGQERADGAVPGRVILQMRADLQKYSANFNAAWQKLRAIGLTTVELEGICSTKVTLKSLPILSSRRGVVAMAEVRIGQMVQPTQHLYRIVDVTKLWIVARVLEADAEELTQGLPVVGKFAMASDHSYSSVIDHIDLQLSDDRTLAVKAWVHNPEGILRPGMFGRVEIQLATEKLVVCPKEALTRDGHERFVLVEQTPGNYVHKQVQVSAEHGDLAIIDEGLFPGDRVVTVGTHELASLFAQSIGSVARGRQPSLQRTFLAQAQVEIPIEKKIYAYAPIEGRIRRIAVEYGQTVRRGDTLAEIECLAFKHLQLEFLQTLVNLKLAIVTVRRLEPLHQSATIPARQFWEAQADLDLLTQGTDALRHKLLLLGMTPMEVNELENTDLLAAPLEVSSILPVRAVADGVVADFELVPGQVVSKECQLFELHDPTNVWVRAYLFEADAPKVHEGQKVDLQFPAASTLRQTGRISRVSPVFHPGQRAMSVWIEVDNQKQLLREGMAATVGIELDDRDVVARN